MEPFRASCIKQIIELRELEKAEDQKYNYMSSDSVTESSTSSDSDEFSEPTTDPSGHKYSNFGSSGKTVCRDDKYFDAIYKVADMPSKDDVYGIFGKKIACQLRNIAEMDKTDANHIMIVLQEKMQRFRKNLQQKLDEDSKDENMVSDMCSS